MELVHDFTLPVPADHAWKLLIDVEKIAPCLPRAVVTSSWLMCGNVELLRHSPNVTGTVLAIEEIFRDAGLPGNVLRTLVVAEPDSPRVNPGDCSQTARP